MIRQEEPIVITGIGAFSPIGKNAAETVASLRAGKSGIDAITLFDTSGLKVKHAGEVWGYDPLKYFAPEEVAKYDRTTQFAQIAADEAVKDCGLDLSSIASDRIAIVSGVCSGTDDPPGTAARSECDTAFRRLVHVRHVQTLHLAKRFGIHGLQASISTACASSSSALAYAYELLQSDRAEVALVGGSDMLLFVTYAGFYALGAMAEQPCSPFSTNVGVTFGEGAGYVVLERLERASARGAKVYGELAGYGWTGDAYHFTSPHPSGDGLRRAMEAALARAGAKVEDIDYINAHGTATRDNDTAESLAVSDLCAGKRMPPPVSSTKSFTGHTLGAAGILEFIMSLLAARQGFLPPTVNFEAPRPGCELDYVPNEARPGKIDFFFSNSAAFGGVNTVVAGRREPVNAVRSRSVPRLVITGIGVVSPAGCGLPAFREALHDNKRSAVQPVKRFDVSDCNGKHAALVSDFKPRNLTPTLDVKRLDLITQYATVSAGLAYSDACLSTQVIDPTKIGSIVALAAGPVATQEAFNKSLTENGVAGVSARYFPAIVISTVGGQVCQALQLKGINSTLCDGVGAGLAGFVHACEMLRGSHHEDQILAIAPDEINRWLFRNLDVVGLLADDACPYRADSRGIVLGEGSFALVLERLDSAQARGARIYAEILGYGATCDPTHLFADSVSDEWMRKCITSALRDARTEPEEIAFATGLGHGRSVYDNAERKAFQAVLGPSMPISLPVSLLGLGLSSCGGAALALGALGLHDRRVYLNSSTASSEPSTFRKSLVFGGSETGNYSAFVLGVPE